MASLTLCQRLLYTLVLPAALLFRATPSLSADTGESLLYRQITLFAITATAKTKSIDPRLIEISLQLQKIKPDHGFQLRKGASSRLSEGEELRCELGGGLTAVVSLDDAENSAGKVRISFQLIEGGRTILDTAVTIPPNQLFFCEKPLDDNSELLIGVGAR